MSQATDVIRGTLKLDNFTDDLYFTSWKDLVNAFSKMFSVEIPAGITNVTVGNEQPTDDERDNLWIRKDASGSFLGVYVYSQGSWRQIIPVPNEYHLIHGDSRTPPKGYTVTDDLTDITAEEKAALRRIWHQAGSAPTWYSIFHVKFTGF